MQDPRSTPAQVRTGRELSGRLEQDFHKRRDPFLRWNRWLCGGACAAVIAWIGLAAATGNRTLYEAGPVAPAHQFFENNCQACHTTWAPAARFRLVLGDRQASHSVDDASCQKCHAGSPHYEGQDPPHAGLSCAACHREHRHDGSLTALSNRQCVECHQSLKGRLAEITTLPNATPHEAPATSITSFSADHPEFDAVSKSGEYALGDTAKIKFNHSVHLRHEYDDKGNLVKGIQNEQGQLEDLSKNCSACHEPDGERRYMQPVRYAQHCQRCHELYFDNQNFPRKVVPHGIETAALRGFLVERYTALALREPDQVQPPSPNRPLPGRRQGESSLTAEARTRVRESAAKADERLIAPIADSEEAARAAALGRETALFGPEALGGCRLCHEIDKGAANRDPRGFLDEWTITPTKIPPRWMSRSRFSHDSHRMVACTSCHKDATANPPRSVTDSATTGDVLMPSIGTCRSCHSEQANILLPLDGGATGRGVASRCIDCHDYHHRDEESISGTVFFDLQKPSAAGKDGS